LSVAGFGGFGAEGLFFAPTGGAEMVGGNAEADEIFLDGVGAALAESEVVFGGTTLVAMAFDGDTSVGIVLEEVRGFLESGAGIGANIGGVVIEVGVANFLEEEFIKTELGRFSDGSGSVDGDADGGIGTSAGTAGSEGVGGGVDGTDGCGTLGSDGADFGGDGDVGGVGGGPSELDGFALIDGIAIGSEAGGGFHRSGRRRIGGRSRDRRFLVAASNEESEGGKRNEQRANDRGVRVSHACPPKTPRSPVLGPLDRAIVPPEGRVRGICRDTIYCSGNGGKTEG
jgi:hypothetical protein